MLLRGHDGAHIQNKPYVSAAICDEKWFAEAYAWPQLHIGERKQKNLYSSLVYELPGLGQVEQLFGKPLQRGGAKAAIWWSKAQGFGWDERSQRNPWYPAIRKEWLGESPKHILHICATETTEAAALVRSYGRHKKTLNEFWRPAKGCFLSAKYHNYLWPV